ncbi:hypothetical protein RHMOL_Rhmol01G0092000 [Rhododendron molle]|uniref:Uncharacterized protein n=1 Tax=Rhododendron molle TaxID=49168 RepID=A0ACC0Q299_RHOML|nr:hypothetical protein RHMOL_Rhmol01G0092000 [Rhododendron molle]
MEAPPQRVAWDANKDKVQPKNLTRVSPQRDAIPSNPMRTKRKSLMQPVVRAEIKQVWRKVINNKPQPIHLKGVGNEWLTRSAVAKLSPLRSIVYVQDRLKLLGYLNIEVRQMGGDKVVLTFSDVGERDSMLSGGDQNGFQEWFVEIKKWEEAMEVPCSRMVWLNCYGIPLHLWNVDTFKKIGWKWGEVVSISDDTFKGLSFVVGKVLISTTAMEIINQVIEVEHKGRIMNIRVIEEQMVINTFLRASCSCEGCVAQESKENKQSENSQEKEEDDDREKHKDPIEEVAETQGTNVNDVEKDKGSIEEVAEIVGTKVNDMEKNKDQFEDEEEDIGSNVNVLGTPVDNSAEEVATLNANNDGVLALVRDSRSSSDCAQLKMGSGRVTLSMESERWMSGKR